MALQRPWAQNDLAASIGAKTGLSLGDTLENLAQYKLNKVEQKNAFDSYKKAGYSDEHANLFAMHRNDPNLLKFIQNFAPGEYQPPSENQGRNAAPAFTQGPQEPERQRAQPLSVQEQQILQQQLGPRALMQERFNQNFGQPQGQDMLQRLQQAQPYEMAKLLNQQSLSQFNRQPQDQDQLRNLLEKSQAYQQEQARQPIQQPQQVSPQQQQAQQQVPGPIRQQNQPQEYQQEISRPPRKSEFIGNKKAGVNPEQKAIDANLKDWNNRLDTARVPATELINRGDHMLDLLKKNTVASGILGQRGNISFVPRNLAFLSGDSQKFAQEGDDVASTLSSGPGMGIQTISKIRFNQERKPNLGQKPEVQVDRTLEFMESAQKVDLRARIRDRLIELNNGDQPKNLDKIVEKEFNNIERELRKMNKKYPTVYIDQDKKSKTYGTIQGLTEGTDYYDDEKRRPTFIVEKNLWWPIL